jgi:DNA-binding beta-propeller fold protein YncE
MLRNAVLVLLCVTCAALMGCGSGSHGSALPTGGTQSTGTGPTTAQFVISVPHAASVPASSSVRTPAYVASTTQSITINLTPHGSGTSIAGFPMTANLTSSTSGCVSSLANLQCTITLTVAPAIDDVTITTFDGANGSGHVLSAAQTVEMTVLEGTTNNLPIALGSVPTGVKIVTVGGTSGGSQNLVFTLPLQGSGQFAVYGTDADANIILGAGAPSVTVTNSNATKYTVTGPAATTPNLINATSLSSTAASSITRLTATVTPVAGTGTGAVSTTVTLQAQTLPIIYTANYSVGKISVYDALGDVLSPPGFAGISGPYNIIYDTANQLLYVLNDSGTAISAYDRSGNSQVLASNFPGLTLTLGLLYDPQNGLLYADAFPSPSLSVFTQNGAATSVSPGTFSGLAYTYGLTYDPVNAWIYGAASGNTVKAWDSNGNAETLSGGFPGISQVQGVAYNAVTGNLYVACVYPNQILAYTPNGSTASVSGPFTLDGQPNSIAADPVSGNVYVSTNADALTAYDQNGNSLWATAQYADGDQSIVAVPPP